jgi:subtilisin family serine protease
MKARRGVYRKILQVMSAAALVFILAAFSGASTRLALAHPPRQRAIAWTEVASAARLLQAPPPPWGEEVQVAPEVEWALDASGTTHVIVALWSPVAGFDKSVQRQQLAQAQDSVLNALPVESFHLLRRYQTIPGLAGVVSSQGLDGLRHHPAVRAIALDIPVHATLTESAALIQADRVWNEFGLAGAGVSVGVLDSGVDLTHPELSDDIVAQHCFTYGACPPDGTDEGENAQDENGHGTHVAGIITSRGDTSPRGIAPDAGIVAVRVLDGSGSGWTSDVVAGIDWIIANQASLDVRIINVSLGGGRYGGVCDTQDASTMLYAAAVEAARDAGAIIFAASGNGAQAEMMMAPACVSDVVSVGSTYDDDLGFTTWPTCTDAEAAVDQVSCFSNSSPALDLLAPGARIVSTALGGGQASRSGTSASAPHAAAVAALIVQGKPGVTPLEIETALKDTGVPVTDRRNGRVTSRVDALAAVALMVSNHITASLAIVPDDLQIHGVATATTEVRLERVSNLYGVDFRLTFDPGVLQVVDAAPNRPGEQIAVGTLFEGRDYLVSRNQVSNTVGVIEFAISLQNQAEPISGTGAVADITWLGQGTGQSALTLEQTHLASPDGAPIPHEVESGMATVYHSPISGTVLLQGRADYRGTTVFLTGEPCPPTVHPTDEIPPGAPSVTTDEQGYFEITPFFPDDDGQCLQAIRHGYLPGWANSPQGNLGTITLPGGDVTRDTAIDIFDLALVASRYGSDDQTADVNADGRVDIFDLTIVAGNYGQHGPVVDWQ